MERVVNGSQDLSRDFQKLRQYLPFQEYQRYNKALKKANRKYYQIKDHL